MSKDEEICEACRRHVFGTNCLGSSGSCTKCLPPGQLLKPCSVCEFVLYCSKKCRKKDRQSHQVNCQVACGIRDRRNALGPVIEAKHKSFEAWCTNTGPFSYAAISALGLHSDFSRINNYVFLVDVRTSPSNRLIGDEANIGLNVQFTHSVESARCASMKEVHGFMDWRFTDGALETERSLAHRPGLMRILFRNGGLPFPLDLYTTPIDVKPSDLRGIPYKPDWLHWLRSRFEGTHKEAQVEPSDPPEAPLQQSWFQWLGSWFG